MATIRDHYPLPITDHVIEWVAGAEAYNFLDGFSGYNQICCWESWWVCECSIHGVCERMMKRELRELARDKKNTKFYY